MTNQHIGSPFEDFLKEEGIYEEVQAHAVKEVLAWQIKQAIKIQGLLRLKWPVACRQAGRSWTAFWTQKTHP